VDAVYRVRGLPLGFDKENTAHLLSTLLELSSSPTIVSLAEALDGLTMMATLRHPEIPAKLSGSLTETWNFSMPDYLKEIRPQGEPNTIRPQSGIMIDKHFRGLTVLRCPSVTDHKVE
jgi:hypothetical protein